MARPLRLRPQQEIDFSVISQLSAERLEAVLARLNRQKAPLIAASDLRSLIQDCLESEEQALALARQLLGFATYCRSANEEPKEAIESLLASLRDTKLEEGEKTNLQKLAPALRELLEHDYVNLSSKALHLGFDYANIYHSGNVITDIRPVFSDGKDKIVGAVISQTLRVHFSSGGQQQELSLALDNDDILALRDACDEALKKAASAKEMMIDKMDIKAFIVGEETYGLG